MTTKTRARLFLLSLLLLVQLHLSPAQSQTNLATSLRFAVTFPASSSSAPLDGRILLLVSTDNSKEPRFQINEDLNTHQVFGVDVEGFKPLQEVVMDSSA